MFQNLNQSYTLVDASMEIFTIFLGAFVLGMMLGWLLKPSKNMGTQTKKEGYIAAKKSNKNGDVRGEDDLQVIEWIGPKTEAFLKKNNITSFKSMIHKDVSWLEEILKSWWSKFQIHNPTTWPDQAGLAMDEKWSELEEYQKILNSGKKKQKK